MILTPTTLGVGAGVAAIIAAWSTVKSYLVQLYGLLFQRVELDRMMTQAFLMYIVKHYKPLKIRLVRYFSRIEKTKKKKHGFYVMFESLLTARDSELTILTKLPGFIIIKQSGDGITITVPRYVSIKKMLIEAINAHSNKYRDFKASRNNFYVGRVSGSRYQPDSRLRGEDKMSLATEVGNAIDDRETGIPINVSASELEEEQDFLAKNLFFDDAMSKAMQEAKFWKENQSWFNDHGVPWKHGWLLYGAPGCGKTRFSAAVGQEINVPVFVFDLSSMTNDDFSRSYATCRRPEGSIILIEDVDAVFHGRRNITTTELSPGLTFDCFLNTIDGADDSNGIFMIVTTNDITKLDPALAGIRDHEMSTRPGRVDRMIELRPLSLDGQWWMAEKILGDFPKPLWADIVGDESLTGAQFQERCCRRAMELFWKRVP